jgi:hypothetical protein
VKSALPALTEISSSICARMLRGLPLEQRASWSLEMTGAEALTEGLGGRGCDQPKLAPLLSFLLPPNLQGVECLLRKGLRIPSRTLS